MGLSSRSNYAAAKDARIKLSEEECVLGMGRRSNDAAKKDVQIKFRKEDCATAMGRTAIQTMNLLHLDHFSNRLPLVNPNQVSMSLELPLQHREDEEP